MLSLFSVLKVHSSPVRMLLFVLWFFRHRWASSTQPAQSVVVGHHWWVYLSGKSSLHKSGESTAVGLWSSPVTWCIQGLHWADWLAVNMISRSCHEQIKVFFVMNKLLFGTKCLQFSPQPPKKCSCKSLLHWGNYYTYKRHLSYVMQNLVGAIYLKQLFQQNTTTRRFTKLNSCKTLILCSKSEYTSPVCEK